MKSCEKCRMRARYDKKPQIPFGPHLEVAYRMVPGLEILY